LGMGSRSKGTAPAEPGTGHP